MKGPIILIENDLVLVLRSLISKRRINDEVQLRAQLNEGKNFFELEL